MEPEYGLQTNHEGQLYLNVFSTPATGLFECQRLEVTLQRLLQAEGDLYAFKVERTTGAEGSIFSAIAEYCDNDVSLKAVARFNNTIIEVSYLDILAKLKLTKRIGRLSTLHCVVSARHPLLRHRQ